MTSSRPLVVIGGGPAGMGAAIEAVRAGLPCTLVDEARQLGGQVYRRPSQEFTVSDGTVLGRDFAKGEELRTEFTAVADRIELRLGTSVPGIWNERDVMWAADGASGLLRAERLVIASGAYDRPVPFPGWTLPGVMAAGGVQVLIKTMRVRPGRRALVAGTGPLILGVARRLHEVGIEVVAVLEAANTSWSREEFPSDWGRWDLIQNAWDAAEYLRREGVPLLRSHTIFEARGAEQVERASYGPVDPQDWRPLKDQGRSAEVDLVVTGFGFVPNPELTVLTGCRHHYVHELGGWVPVRDALMQTSVSGVFAAGDGAGVSGALVALEEGRIAGISAAQHAGVIGRAEAENRRAASLERLRSLAPVRQAIAKVSWIRPGLLALASSETFMCRCEEVRLSEVQSALDQGARDLQSTKLLTRLGMGPCQGRNCAPSTGMYLCRVTGQRPEEIGRINPRPPVRPVTLGAMALTEGVPEVAAGDPLDAIGAGGAP